MEICERLMFASKRVVEELHEGAVGCVETALGANASNIHNIFLVVALTLNKTKIIFYVMLHTAQAPFRALTTGSRMVHFYKVVNIRSSLTIQGL